MPNRTTKELNFGRLGRRHLQANVQGGDISSDGGLMPLRLIDARTGLSRLTAKALTDRRAGGGIRHRLRDLIAQRLYGLCCGYEDLNDHDTLRSGTRASARDISSTVPSVICLRFELDVKRSAQYARPLPGTTR